MPLSSLHRVLGHATLVLALTACPKQGSTTNAPAPSIPFEKYELGNGLDVILSEDHSVPFVWVEVWYNVGSKDEKPGLTGFAHLFEHLMFQGSKNMNDEYFKPLQRVGARINGTTNFDRTNYYEGVPSEQLPLALWLEADRMGWLLPALDEAKLKNQQDVVRNERRQRYENRPYGQAWVWLVENVFPEGHPYHVPTIGRHEDIENAKLTDVHQFFSTWYVPNGASLAIVGDFDPAEAKGLVDRYFSEIPAGAAPSPRLSAPHQIPANKVVHYESRVPHKRVTLAWTSPPSLQPGDAELDILSSLLSSGEDSLLYRRLVETGLASSVDATQVSLRLQSIYVIEATAATGHDTPELVAAIDEVLAEVRSRPVENERLSSVKTMWERNFYGAVQTLAGRASQLSSYNNLTGDPGYLAKDLERYRSVTPEALQDAAKAHLPADRRVELHIHPLGKAPAGAILDPHAGAAK